MRVNSFDNDANQIRPFNGFYFLIIAMFNIQQFAVSLP
jgi:hypothetical protein